MGGFLSCGWLRIVTQDFPDLSALRIDSVLQVNSDASIRRIKVMNSFRLACE